MGLRTRLQGFLQFFWEGQDFLLQNWEAMPQACSYHLFTTTPSGDVPADPLAF